MFYVLCFKHNWGLKPVLYVLFNQIVLATVYCIACFQWKHSGRVVFIFSSITRVLVWCGLKQAENVLKTIYFSDPRLSLGENVCFQKWAFSACFQAENEPFINSGTGEVGVFIERASSAGICKQSMGARNRVGIALSYRPARLYTHTTAWRNWFLGINSWAS